LSADVRPAPRSRRARDPDGRLVLAARLYVAAVVVVSLMPTRQPLEATFGERQTTATLSAHFLEFVVLGVLVTLAAARRRGPREARLVAVAVGMTVAVVTELLQGVLPYRSLEVRDLVVNLLGLAVGLAAVSLRGAARGGPERRA
jgi:VanZ family protein